MSNFKTFAILDNNGEKLYSTELSPDDFNFMRFFTKGVDSLKNKEKVSLTKTLTKLNESDEFRVQSILVIEDDPTTLKSLMMEIKLKGHYVEGVEDVETASAILKKDPKRFDIILTDNMMPSGESGSSFAKKVKKENSDVMVFIISGDSSSIDKDVFEHDVDGTLAKPITEFSLITLLGGAGRKRVLSGR